MGYRKKNWIDDTGFEFPRTGFWIIHVAGSLLLFLMGMRFAARRAPLPVILFRLLKTLR